MIFIVFLIEMFVYFTVGEVLRSKEEGVPDYEIGLNLIAGYLIRIYMTYALIKGLFLC